MSVHYYYEQKKTTKDNAKDTGGKFYWAYVPLKFYTEGEAKVLEEGIEYTASHDESIITYEYSKRQLKKYMKAKAGKK